MWFDNMSMSTGSDKKENLSITNRHSCKIQKPQTQPYFSFTKNREHPIVFEHTAAAQSFLQSILPDSLINNFKKF